MAFVKFHPSKKQDLSTHRPNPGAIDLIPLTLKKCHTLNYKAENKASFDISQSKIGI